MANFSLARNLLEFGINLFLLGFQKPRFCGTPNKACPGNGLSDVHIVVPLPSTFAGKRRSLNTLLW